jgi:hypothetical protein
MRAREITRLLRSGSRQLSTGPQGAQAGAKPGSAAPGKAGKAAADGASNAAAANAGAGPGASSAAAPGASGKASAPAPPPPGVKLSKAAAAAAGASGAPEAAQEAAVKTGRGWALPLLAVAVPAGAPGVGARRTAPRSLSPARPGRALEQPASLRLPGRQGAPLAQRPQPAQRAVGAPAARAQFVRGAPGPADTNPRPLPPTPTPRSGRLRRLQ